MSSPPESARSSDTLFAEVYDRLKAMAGRQLSSAERSTTFDTTVLVHELYLRMSANRALSFEQPGQFFSYAARAMRHLLCDRARAHKSQRALRWVQITLTGAHEAIVLESAEKVIALDGALDRLAALDERAAKVIELRYFAGLTSEQAAEMLEVSKRTVDRDWTFALAFLKTDLG